nr:amino acid ABC transporter permease [uncultured Eubacterium sp.]
MHNFISNLFLKMDMIPAISLKRQFELAFLEKDRWKLYITGLENTLIITFGALLVGVLIGALIAVVRTTYDRTYTEMNKGAGKAFLAIFNLLCKIYLTVIRGTPVVVQIMIIFFIVFAGASTDANLAIAILAFGINSGAYVAEIFRSGIMSIDIGQTEAGRSLGFNYTQTMLFVIIPQAFKNVLPTLGNEFIVLLKETSVCGYIGLMDLTRAGDSVRAATYLAFVPLIVVAIVYLVMVMFSTWLLGKLERRLRNDER